MSRRRNRRGRRSRNISFPIGPVFGIGGAIIGVLLLLFLLVKISNAGVEEVCRKASMSYGIFSTSNVCEIDQEYAHEKITIVVGNTEDSVAPILTETAKRHFINSIAQKDGVKVTVISATPSSPRILSKTFEADIDDSELGTIKASDYINILQEKVEEISQTLSVLPTENHVDYFQAIESAKKGFKNVQKDKSFLIVIGSGLSDTGTLDFSMKNYLSISEEELEEELENISSSINTSTNTLWIGASLSPNKKYTNGSDFSERIISIYKETLNLEIELDKESDEIPDIPNKTAGYIVNKPTFTDVAGEETFVAESIEYKNPEEVGKFLDKVAEKLKENTSLSVQIKGWVYQIDLPNRPGCNNKTLSQCRADKFKNELEARGINSTRIQATGMGVDTKNPESKARRVEINYIQ